MRWRGRLPAVRRERLRIGTVAHVPSGGFHDPHRWCVQAQSEGEHVVKVIANVTTLCFRAFSLTELIRLRKAALHA
jgi:hypothetical protein